MRAIAIAGLLLVVVACGGAAGMSGGPGVRAGNTDDQRGSPPAPHEPTSRDGTPDGAEAASGPIEILRAMSRSALAATGAVKQEIEGPDGKLAYWIAGSGPTVVLLHGTNDQAGLWWQVVRDLGAQYRFVIPDMPGHGESDPATGPLDLGMMLAAVESLAETVSPEEPFVLVGNSMGGWVALLYALEHPERVSHLVLESAGGISLDPDFEPPALVPRTREEARIAFDAAIGPDGLVPDAVLDDFVRRAPFSEAARMLEAGFERYILDDRIAGVRVPVTLIWGDADGVLPLSFGRRMASMIPGSVLHAIPGCGHIPHNECAKEFVTLLEASLHQDAAGER
jgi:pimeloyl-ACP methyl ester carboxylesterase